MNRTAQHYQDQALIAELVTELTKSADTLADAARTFKMFSKPLAFEAMKIAEEHIREVINNVKGIK